MYERLVLMRELLAENGSIYVHLDWHVGHYVKVMMDEIFGYENMVNEIIWWYRDPSGAIKNAFMRKHDVIYFILKMLINISLTWMLSELPIRKGLFSKRKAEQLLLVEL
jgi:adenine specific DNA methylase Mod